MNLFVSRICPWLKALLSNASYRTGWFILGRHRIKVIDFVSGKFYYPGVLMPIEELEKKYRETVQNLAQRQGAENLGDYLEFGVFRGDSMLCMSRTLLSLGLDRVRMFGFDSFEGLPESAEREPSKLWKRGQFRADYEATIQRLSQDGIDWRRTCLVKGFYESTLNGELIRQYGMQKASVILIDCDLYSSTKEALAFCAPLIRDETAIFFDDWNCTDESDGEKKAFAEFLETNPDLMAEEDGSYQLNAQVFRVYRRVGEH